MKVKELIEILQKLDPETLVLVDGYEGDYNTPREAKQINVTGPFKAPWYYGEYKDRPKDELISIDAIYLPR